MKTKQITFRLLALLIFCVSISISPRASHAQSTNTVTYVVDTFEDLYDPAPNGLCAGWIGPDPDDFGPCSLRAAITEAGYTHAGTPEFVHIQVPPGVYKLTLTETPFDPPPSDGSDDKHYGDLDLPKVPSGQTPNEVLIEGTGGSDNPSVIDANFIDRVLELGQGRTLTLRNLILKNGLINADNNNAASGGGILMKTGSMLRMNNVRLTNNTVRCADGTACNIARGGAIGSENANLSLFEVELDGNHAFRGSAIYFWDGTPNADQYELLIERTAIHHNSGDYSTIAGNGSLFITNSTMVANESHNIQSDVGNIDMGGPVWIQNSTVISSHPIGNVIVNDKSLYIRNSILLNTPGTSSTNYRNCIVDAPFTAESKGGNIFSENSCNPNTALHDLVLTYAETKLGALADYGGFTPTIALVEGSPAVNRLPEKCIVTTFVIGPPMDVDLVTDQRGSPRDDGQCDTGAFEGSIRPMFLYLPIITKK